jgi:5-methylcytosine-specific restriction endonuclease McrA
MKRKKGVVERAMEGAEADRKAFMKAQEETMRALEADQNRIRRAIKSDQEALKRASEIPGWSQADVNKSVNGFMTEQERMKPRKPISRGLLKRLMARSRGNCENCGKNLYNEKIEIHHKNSDRTDDRESNLMVVCRPCHKKLTGPRPNKTT